MLPRLLLLACGRLAREAAPRPIEVLQRHAAHGQGQRRWWAGCGKAEGRRRGVWGVRMDSCGGSTNQRENVGKVRMSDFEGVRSEKSHLH